MDFDRNIWKLKVLKGFQFLLFFLPILVPFYQSNGLSVGQVVNLQALFGVAVVLLEVPTGYVSDRWSRKMSLVIGFLSTSICYFLYWFEGGFWYFAGLQVLNAFGTSLISGSSDALLYDSLLAMGKSYEYVKQRASVTRVARFMEAVAGIIGGTVAVWGFYNAIFLQGVALFCGFLVALSLVEVPVHGREGDELGHWEEVKEAYRIGFVENVGLRWVMILSAVVGGMTFGSVWFFQPILMEGGVDVAWFGWYWAGMSLLVWGWLYFVPWFQKRFELFTLFCWMPVVCGISYVLIGVVASLWSVVFYVGVAWTRAMKSVLINHTLNKLIPSYCRATVLSMNSMLFRALYALLGPAMGVVADVMSIWDAFVWSAVVFGGLVIVPLLSLKGRRDVGC